MSEETSPIRQPQFEVIAPPFDITNYNPTDPNRGGFHVGTGRSPDFNFPHQTALLIDFETAFTPGTPPEAHAIVLGRTTALLPQNKPSGILVDITDVDQTIAAEGSKISKNHGIIRPSGQKGNETYTDDGSKHGSRIHRLKGHNGNQLEWTAQPVGKWQGTQQDEQLHPTQVSLDAVNILEFPHNKFLLYYQPDNNPDCRILIPVDSPDAIPDWLKAQIKTAHDHESSAAEIPNAA